MKSISSFSENGNLKNEIKVKNILSFKEYMIEFAEQIQENWNKLIQLIEDTFEGERKEDC